MEAIRRFPTAREAFQLSRTPQASRWCRGDWERVKDDIMLKALRCKFTGNPELRKRLLDTGSRRLIEHTHNDSYWADGGDGSGKNKLGKILERVRSELQTTPPPQDTRAPRARSGSFSQFLTSSVESLSLSTSKGDTQPKHTTAASSHGHQSPLKRSNSFSTSSRSGETAGVTHINHVVTYNSFPLHGHRSHTVVPLFHGLGKGASPHQTRRNHHSPTKR